MPEWARGVLLAKVSRAPRGLPREVLASEAIMGPAAACERGGSVSAKRKRGAEPLLGHLPRRSACPSPMEQGGTAARAPVVDGGPPCGTDSASARAGTGIAPRTCVKSEDESPLWSPIPGEDSLASNCSWDEEEGGTYLCPAWAIKQPRQHLVYTSAYEGDDADGTYWAAARPGEGVAVRIIRRPADTAVDTPTGAASTDPRSPTADYDRRLAGAPADLGDPDPGHQGGGGDRPLAGPLTGDDDPGDDRHPEPSAGPRESARYGLRGQRIGEASHPGPPSVPPYTTGPRVTPSRDQDYVLRAAEHQANLAEIDRRIASARALIPTPEPTRRTPPSAAGFC